MTLPLDLASRGVTAQHAAAALPAGAASIMACMPERRGGPNDARAEGAGVRSLRRGLEVLQAIADSGGEASLRDIAKRLHLAESTTHGLLQTLVLSGHVFRTAERRYGLGHALIRLGEATNRKLGAQTTDALQELATLTGENVDLAVLEGADAVYIAQAVMPGSTRSVREAERRLPARSTAAGRALLSQLTPAEFAAFLARHANSATDPGRLVTELAQIRRRGFATEIDEVEPGVSCVAVPLATDAIPMALTVTGPSERLTRQRMPALTPHLRRVAGEIARGLRRSG